MRLISLLVLMILATALKAEAGMILILRDGKAIETDSVRFEGNMLYYSQHGGEVGLPITRVSRINALKDQQDGFRPEKEFIAPTQSEQSTTTHDKWRIAFSMTGKEDHDTDSFNLAGTKGKIRWRVDCPRDDYLNVDLHDHATGRYIKDILTTHQNNGERLFRGYGRGRYYLEIRVYSNCSWSIYISETY